MGAVLNEMVSLLTQGISGIATGVGNGLQALVTNIFLVEGAEGAMELSTMGSMTLIFGGISLAIGLSTLVFRWLTSLGN